MVTKRKNLIGQTYMRVNVTLLIIEYNWLPVPERLLFKVALMALDYSVRGQGPGYFDDVLVPVHTVGARARL